jgi:DnaJ-class molecular chaperone
MKRINEYKKLFEVEDDHTLGDLKLKYRSLVKTWHPDKFQDNDARAEEAEAISRRVIDGYHFLVSIAPETREATLDEYTRTISEVGILDYKHKGIMLEITFNDGSTYEYFGVPKNVFNKFHNSDKQVRFGKRNIFHSYVYRKAKSGQMEASA